MFAATNTYDPLRHGHILRRRLYNLRNVRPLPLKPARVDMHDKSVRLRSGYRQGIGKHLHQVWTAAR
jgi:hypothetical protein